MYTYICGYTYWYVYPQILFLLRRENGFSKLFLQLVHNMHKESAHVHGQCSVGVVRGVAGPRSFKKALII